MWVFRWFRDLRGEMVCQKADTHFPNHSVAVMVAEHKLTSEQALMLDLDQLKKLFLLRMDKERFSEMVRWHMELHRITSTMVANWHPQPSDLADWSARLLDVSKEMKAHGLYLKKATEGKAGGGVDEPPRPKANVRAADGDANRKDKGGAR